jgi:hypothetical protein
VEARWGGGRGPRQHGPAFDLKDESTWGTPAAQHQAADARLPWEHPRPAHRLTPRPDPPRLSPHPFCAAPGGKPPNVIDVTGGIILAAATWAVMAYVVTPRVRALRDDPAAVTAVPGTGAVPVPVGGEHVNPAGQKPAPAEELPD